MSDDRKQTHTIRIKAAVDRVWEELTRTDGVQRFYFDSRIDGAFEEGKTIRYVSPDGKHLFITGTVKEIEPGRRLVHDFKFSHIKEPPSLVSFTLTPHGDETEVRIEHSDFTGNKHFNSVKSGWPFILGNLKRWLETGTLPFGTRFRYGLMKLFMHFVPKA